MQEITRKIQYCTYSSEIVPRKLRRESTSGQVYRASQRRETSLKNRTYKDLQMIDIDTCILAFMS